MHKKLIIGMLAVLALVVCTVDAATTVNPQRLGIEEMASHMGANFLVEISYADFTQTATNNTEEFTWDIAAGQGFTLLYAEVVQEFVGSTTNGTDNMAVIVGDDADTDQFLVSMKMATEETEVVGKFGTGTADGVFYEAADTIDFLFTPNLDRAPAAFSAGKVRFWCFVVE